MGAHSKRKAFGRHRNSVVTRRPGGDPGRLGMTAVLLGLAVGTGSIVGAGPASATGGDEWNSGAWNSKGGQGSFTPDQENYFQQNLKWAVGNGDDEIAANLLLAARKHAEEDHLRRAIEVSSAYSQPGMSKSALKKLDRQMMPPGAYVASRAEDGTIHVGSSGSTVNPIAGSSHASAYENVPQEGRPQHHGHCGEVACFNQNHERNQKNETDFRVTHTQAVEGRGGGNYQTFGTPKAPCEGSCAPAQETLGVQSKVFPDCGPNFSPGSRSLPLAGCDPVRESEESKSRAEGESKPQSPGSGGGDGKAAGSDVSGEGPGQGSGSSGGGQQRPPTQADGLPGGGSRSGQGSGATEVRPPAGSGSSGGQSESPPQSLQGQPPQEPPSISSKPVAGDVPVARPQVTGAGSGAGVGSGSGSGAGFEAGSRVYQVSPEVRAQVGRAAGGSHVVPLVGAAFGGSKLYEAQQKALEGFPSADQIVKKRDEAWEAYNRERAERFVFQRDFDISGAKNRITGQGDSEKGQLKQEYAQRIANAPESDKGELNRQLDGELKRVDDRVQGDLAAETDRLNKYWAGEAIRTAPTEQERADWEANFRKGVQKSAEDFYNTTSGTYAAENTVQGGKDFVASQKRMFTGQKSRTGEERQQDANGMGFATGGFDPVDPIGDAATFGINSRHRAVVDRKLQENLDALDAQQTKQYTAPDQKQLETIFQNHDYQRKYEGDAPFDTLGVRPISDVGEHTTHTFGSAFVNQDQANQGIQRFNDFKKSEDQLEKMGAPVQKKDSFEDPWGNSYVDRDDFQKSSPAPKAQSMVYKDADGTPNYITVKYDDHGYVSSVTASGGGALTQEQAAYARAALRKNNQLDPMLDAELAQQAGQPNWMTNKPSPDDSSHPDAKEPAGSPANHDNTTPPPAAGADGKTSAPLSQRQADGSQADQVGGTGADAGGSGPVQQSSSVLKQDVPSSGPQGLGHSELLSVDEDSHLLPGQLPLGAAQTSAGADGETSTSQGVSNSGQTDWSKLFAGGGGSGQSASAEVQQPQQSAADTPAPTPALAITPASSAAAENQSAVAPVTTPAPAPAEAAPAPSVEVPAVPAESAPVDQPVADAAPAAVDSSGGGDTSG
jgi:hypothetical protein